VIEPRLDDFLNMCRHCDTQVIWADDTKAGTRFPLNADMDACHEKGTIALAKGTDGDLKASTPSAGQAAGMRAAGVTLYAMHALTCPKAEVWHKVGQHGKATRRVKTRR
jgi:hypothetical protein